MAEEANTDSDFTVNPPDLSREKGPVAWFARKIQRALGVVPNPEAGSTKINSPKTPQTPTR